MWVCSKLTRAGATPSPACGAKASANRGVQPSSSKVILYNAKLLWYRNNMPIPKAQLPIPNGQLPTPKLLRLGVGAWALVVLIMTGASCAPAPGSLGPLADPARVGDLATLKRLIAAGANPNAADPGGNHWTPLLHA